MDYSSAVTTDPHGPLHGERMLWVGTPARFSVLDRVGMFWLGFGVCSGLLGVVVAIAAAGNQGFMIMIALLAVCLLSLSVAMVLQLRSGRRSSRYLITDKRIVHTVKWFGLDRAIIASLAELGPPVVSASAGSTIGTIRFGNHTAWHELWDAVSNFGRSGSIVLREIDNVQEVRDIIVAAQARSH